MPEEQLELDSPAISISQFKHARNKGEETVAVAPPEEEEEKKAEEQEDEEKPKHKIKGGFQVKIDRLTKLNAEAEKRAELAEKRAQELEAKVTKPKADDEPKREDFEDDPSYYKALGRWTARVEMREQAEAAKKAAKQAEAETIFEIHNENISASRAKYDDFDEAINETKTPWRDGNEDHVAASQALHVAIVESGIGGEILYFLAKHPEEMEKMVDYTPARVTMAIGKIADKLEAADEKEPAKKAAEEDEEEEKPKKVPVRPISGTAKSDVPLADMTSLRDFKKARNAGRIR